MSVRFSFLPVIFAIALYSITGLPTWAAPENAAARKAEATLREYFEFPRRPLEASDLERLSVPSYALEATTDHPAVVFATATGTSELTICSTYPVILTSSGEEWSIAGSEEETTSWYWEDVWTTADRGQIWATLNFHCESSNGQVMLVHSPDGGRTWRILATVPLGNYNTTGYDTFQLAPDGNATLVGSWYDDGYGVPCPASPKEAVNGSHETCRGVVLKESSDGGRTWEQTRAFHGSFHRFQARNPSVVHSFIDYDYLELDKLKQRFGPAPAPVAQSRLPGADSLVFDEALLARATAVTRFNRPFLEVRESEPSDSMIPYLLDTGNRDRQEGRLIRLPYPGYQWTAMGQGSWAGILQKNVTDVDDIWVVQCLNPTREWTAGKLSCLPKPPYAFDSLIELENCVLELHVRLLPDGRNPDERGREIYSSTDEGRTWVWSRFEADVLVPVHTPQYPRIISREEADVLLAEKMGEAIENVSQTRTTLEADVIVYGTTPSGFCAAIAAAREGASVILLEPTGHVGGVNTGGLSFSDSNQTVRSTVMGLFDEWHTRIQADYAARGVELPYDVAVKDQSVWTYEPHVAMRVTRAMLDEAGVQVLTNRPLELVTKDGARITTLVTRNGTFSARTYVDATYEGDLMAAAGVGWTIGREGRAAYGESLAGKQYPKKKMEIYGLDDSGQTLPLITTTDAGPEAEGDNKVMVYSFRLCLTADPDNRVPFPAPDHYDPARFEAIRRYAQSGGTNFGWDLYPLPGNKFDGNNSIGGQFSLGLVGACNGWSEADAEGRQTIWEAHKKYTLEFYHFLTTDPAVPEAIRDKFAPLGLCKDEFPEYGHFSPQLYVREGRRMKGMYVVTQKDILDSPGKEDPIAVSSFPIDSHDVQRVALPDGGVINEGTIFPVRMKGRRHGYPYHIPYRAILPQPEECTNLLVPVALSCTHVAVSSIRVEPTWMILGQSAGIAAALAAKHDVAVQELPYPTLRNRLLAQGQVLDLPDLPPLPPDPKKLGAVDPKSLPGIVLDDTDAEISGTWKHSTNFPAYIGKGYVHDDSTSNTESMATFRFTTLAEGEYELCMAYSAHPTRATNVPIEIVCGDLKTQFVVNQRLPLPAGKHFRPIGRLTVPRDGQCSVTVHNTGTDGFVILDALHLVRVAP